MRVARFTTSFHFSQIFKGKMYLAPSDDVMAPVVGSAAVAPFADGVWRTDALACVGVTVVPHVVAITSWGSLKHKYFSVKLILQREIGHSFTV